MHDVPRDFNDLDTHIDPDMATTIPNHSIDTDQTKPSFKTVAKTDGRRSSVQEVRLGEQLIGVVWKEDAHVLVSKITEPRRTALKSRWFARRAEQAAHETLGKGTRAAALLGAGFKSRDAAVAAIQDTTERARA